MHLSILLHSLFVSVCFAPSVFLDDFLATRKGEQAPQLEFEQLPFSHPLFIMFSSGTTGAPKCMVHSAGVRSSTVCSPGVSELLEVATESAPQTTIPARLHPLPQRLYLEAPLQVGVVWGCESEPRSWELLWVSVAAVTGTEAAWCLQGGVCIG